MPETRIVETISDGKGNILEEICGEVSDEELAVEAEQAAMARANELIDGIANLAAAKVFLKKLCKRLIANRALP